MVSLKSSHGSHGFFFVASNGYSLLVSMEKLRRSREIREIRVQSNVMQHPLPTSFRQQEGGALMVLIQSKKMKSFFPYLILGLLQGADS